MRRAVSLLLLGVVVAALGVATARAAALGRPLGDTTTGITTTTTTTTTATTTNITATTTTATTTTATATTATTAATITTTTPPPTTTSTTSPRHIAKPKHSSRTHHLRKHRQRQPMSPPPDYPSSPYPFLVGGGLAPTAQDNAVVSIAMRYLGVPYKWGGARPKTGFDCSGLVQYVFAQLGVSLPHYTAAQWHSPDAISVPPNRLQPGDLVFFTGSDGTRKEPGHVGIYLGDGYLIDAPHTGSFVRIDRLNEPWFANKYVGAKQIVGPSLHARLLQVTKRKGAVPAARLILPQQMTGPAFGVPLPPIAIDPAAAHTSAPRQYELRTGVGLGGVLLLLAGAVPYRRRRQRARGQPEH
jgi:cell wall-associated NlpC family hydrolase